MKKYFNIFIVFCFLYSCKSILPKDSNSDTAYANSLEEDLTNYFRATGNEPFWELKIGREKILFTSLIKGKENLSFSSIKPIKTMDANIKTYKASNGESSIIVSIQQIECQNSMSGIISTYKVSIKIKSSTETTFQKIEGCGKYITDYRLHDIWVLEELKGNKVFAADFQKELPLLEIYAEENRFIGFSGCNSISGSLFFEKDLLRFNKIVSTLMACPKKNNKEDMFIKALQSATTYSIKNNRLSLSSPSGKLLVFKKVD